MKIMFNKFMPVNQKDGYRGFYPVTNAQEWDELPAVYKAMEWFPIEMKLFDHRGELHTEKTIVKNVVFDALHIMPYKVSAKVSVHRSSVQSILFSSHKQHDCHLYTVCEVEFENGERRRAKWVQDTRTGAFAIMVGSRYVGKQGGFQFYVPSNIEDAEDGFKWKGYVAGETITHYDVSNPFR